MFKKLFLCLGLLGIAAQASDQDPLTELFFGSERWTD